MRWITFEKVEAVAHIRSAFVTWESKDRLKYRFDERKIQDVSAPGGEQWRRDVDPRDKPGDDGATLDEFGLSTQQHRQAR